MVVMVFIATAQSKYYPIDLSHSQIKFIGHLGGMMDVEGNFGDFWGYVRFDENNLNETSVTLIVEPSSVVSGNEWRDKHLKNPDFLDVEKYSRILFQSRSVVADGKSLWVTGDLELKGEKREMTIPMELVYPPTPDPWGNRRVGFKGTLNLSREEFAMGPTEGFWANSIADEFEMEFLISASQQNMDRMGHFARSPMKELYEAAEKGNVDTVRTQLTVIKEEGKLEPWMVNQLGMKLDQHDKPKEALKVYELNRELFADDNTAHSNLALAYMDRGKVGKAKEFAQTALQKNPKDALALELLK